MLSLVLSYMGLEKFPGRGLFFNISVLVDLNNFCQMKSVDLELNFSNHDNHGRRSAVKTTSAISEASRLFD